MKTISVSKRLEDIPISSVRKLTPYAQATKAEGVKIYHLNIGDPDVKTPDIMLKVLHEWNYNPIRYAQSQGEPEFLKALESYFHDLGYKSVNPKNMVVTVGGSEAVVISLYAVANPGEEVLVFEPFYSNYSACASFADVKLVAVPTRIEDGFHLPSQKQIEAKITKKTRAILFCSPGNPTGTVYSKEEIEILVKVAKKHNLFLISDEVYREYIFDNKKHVSILSYINELPEQIILLDSLSKRYALCGARLGILMTLNENILKGAIKLAQSRLSAGFIEQVMAAKLTQVKQSYIDAVRIEYQKRRDVLYEGLMKIPGVFLAKPEGAFYSMVSLPVKDAEDFAIFLLKEFRINNETVMLAPGGGFYGTKGKGQDQVRIAYVLNTQDLKTSIKIIDQALKSYQSK